MYPWFWLGLFLVLLIVEGLTFTLTTIWFAGGALCATVVSLIFAPLMKEWIIDAPGTFLSCYLQV